MTEHQKQMTDYLAAFVEEMVQAGVKEAAISPGSRSTPLALLMEEHPTLKTFIDVDERSAGFFALGISKNSKRPVVLLCTSGTAAANFLPAIAEANLAQVPLIVLTADRPHELRQVGAPQAIDQLHLYGSHVKDFTDMALPESNPEMLRYAKWHGSRAVDIAMKTPRGPVHINFPLREPLMPILEPSPYTISDTPRRHVHIYYTHEVLEERAVKRMAEQLNNKKGVIVVGSLDKKEVEPALINLAEKLQWPILADPLSGLRSYGDTDDFVLDQYDAFLKNTEQLSKLEPEVIIRFGSMPVSKPLKNWMETLTHTRLFVVDPGAAWRDPIKAVTDMIHCDERFLIEALLNEISESAPVGWLAEWQQTNSIASEVVREVMENTANLDEGKVVDILRTALPDHAGLFIGNSMAIRDVDTYFAQTKKKIKMLANRGANGIDGVVSAALGASTVTQPMYLLIGDLSFYHGMNGLLMAKKYQLNLTIVLINNDGGGIFSFLPQNDHPKYFETLFGTSTDLDFTHAAKLYGANYQQVTEIDALKEALDQAAYHKGLDIIEIKTSRQANKTNHLELWKQIATKMAGE